MTADLRGFHYSLEPLRHQRKWQLDALLAKLGKLQGEVARAEQQLDDLKGRHRHESSQAVNSLAHGLDPLGYARTLRWLAYLSIEIHACEAHLAALKAQRTLLQERCLTQQQKVDVIEAHREECVVDFTTELTGKQATESDRDWLCRLPKAPSHGKSMKRVAQRSSRILTQTRKQS